MSVSSTATPRILVLYTELAPYVVACLRALVAELRADVHVVHWPVNKEAPFRLEMGEGVHRYDRSMTDDGALLALARQLDPDLVLCSGWIDKGYLKVCRKLRSGGAHTVMCSDTAWRGDLKQRVATVIGKATLHGIFSHAWVTGERQRTYALKLGFEPGVIRTGFYAADIDRFLPLGRAAIADRTRGWPHRFLCVARYIGVKNHQLLCDAFAELCHAGQAGDWELWFTGTGELFDAVTNSPSGRHPRIKHLGFVQVDDMPDVLTDCGVFILPSAYEPWGVVVQELACAGFPLALSSEVRAAERFLSEGINGMTFPAGDKEALERTMRAFVDKSDAQLAAMGAKSIGTGAAWGPQAWVRTAATMIPERNG